MRARFGGGKRGNLYSNCGPALLVGGGEKEGWIFKDPFMEKTELLNRSLGGKKPEGFLTVKRFSRRKGETRMI